MFPAAGKISRRRKTCSRRNARRNIWPASCSLTGWSKKTKAEARDELDLPQAATEAELASGAQE
jgi:hypothetical protein